MENLKNGTKILIIKEFGNTNIIYEQRALRFEKNDEECGFEKGKVTDMSWYTSKENKFEILSEEDEEIDIQSIEKLEYETTIEILGASDCWKGNELYCLKTFSKNDENLLKSNAENHKKINELIKALKQLDKKIKEKEND